MAAKNAKSASFFQKLTLSVLVFLLVFSSVPVVLGQEAPVHEASQTQAETDSQLPSLESEPTTDSEPEVPAEEVTPAEEKGTEDPAMETDKEEAQEQEQVGDPQGNKKIGFQMPTQAKATVDQSTGALNYSYSFDMPAGRAGMTPELSLSYDSRSSSKADGIAGLGWSLSIPYIQREPVKGTQNLFDKAYFSSSLSGNLISTTNTTSSQFTTYRSEVDSGQYLKYTYNSDNSWTMIGKDGRTFTFGATAASRQDKSGDAAKVYKWMLSKIADAHGNEIQYSYVKDNGQIYPSQIVYTYHPSLPAVNTINFNYTTPTNYGSTVYNTGFPVTTYKILTTIDVSTTTEGFTSSFSYILDYSDAQFIKQKLLKTVTKTSSMASSEYNQTFDDVTSFSYSTKTPAWEQDSHSLAGYLPNMGNGTLNNVRSADFDGNGFVDILVTLLEGTTHTNYLLMNNGSNFTESLASWNLPSNKQLSLMYAIADMNGDKLPDLQPRYFEANEYPPVYLNTGSGFVTDNSRTWFIHDYISDVSNCGVNVGDNRSFDTNTFLYDINFDGKNDLIYFGGTSNFKVSLNNGNGFTPTSNYSFTAAPGSNFTIQNTCTGDIDNDNYQALLDINGDGLADYYHVDHGVYLNTGSGFAYSAAYDVDIDEMDRSGFADINGDSLLDYIGFKWLSGSNSCVRVMINNGSGFTDINPTTFPSSCTDNGLWSPGALSYANGSANFYGTLMDITSDGFPDIFGTSASNSNNGKLRAINDSKSEWVNNPNLGDLWRPIISSSLGRYLDINSDNILDFFTYSTNWDGGGSYQSQVYIGKQAVPNRLTQITTPLGAQTVIDYGTAKTNNDDTNPSPMSVVKKITVQNVGQGQPSSVIKYDYVGGAYVMDPSNGTKRFAGFQKVTATESGDNLTPLRVSETYFHQANGSDSATSEPVDTSLALIGKPYYSVTKNSTGTLKRESWNKYDLFTLQTEPVTGRLAKFVYPTESVTKTTEPSATTGTAEVYTFDTNIGERTELRSLGFVTVGSGGSYTDISGDSKYEFTEYAVSGDGTIVKPKRVDLRKTSLAADTVARTDFFYDGQAFGVIGNYGDSTKQTNWVSGNGLVTADTVSTYDSYGNPLTITNPRGAITTYTYDSTKSLVATETNHLNQTTSYQYLTGKLKQATDPNGQVTTYGYSDKGWLYRATVAKTAGNQISRYYLNCVSGNCATVTETQTVNSVLDKQWQSIDNLGRPVRLMKLKVNHETSADGGIYVKEVRSYDALGRQVTVSAPVSTVNTTGDYSSSYSTSVSSNLVTTTTYDVFDRPLSVTNALGSTTFAYAGAETTTTDANTHQKKTKTDAYSNLVQVKEYNGSSVYTTDYVYNIQNLLTKITDAFGNVRNFTYNNAGWLTNSEDLHAPSDATFGTYVYTYDLNGNQTMETQPNSTFVTRVYDMLDRPTVINGSTTMATDFTLSYDTCTNGKGRLCSVNGILPNGVSLSKSYVYSTSGAPTSVSLTTQGNTYTTSYQYNKSDEVKQVTYPNNTIVRTVFGDWAKPSKVLVTLPGQAEALYATNTYHFTEQPEQTVVASGPTTTYTYDANKLYRKANMTSVMSGNTLQSYAYAYDPVGNITSITEPGLTKTYQYDDLNRLTQATHTTTPGGSQDFYFYSYNAIGNITSNNGLTYSYSGANKTNPHAVTSIGASTYTYDDNGNIATAPGKSYLFNWQNQMTSAYDGTNIVTFAYDENGQRFLYQSPTNTEISLGDGYLLRNGAPEISLDLAGAPLGVISGGAIHASISDHLGTSVKKVNTSGTITESTSYGPYGTILSQTGTLNAKEGYTGHEYDVDTGLNYMDARYYNPSIGRFLSQDPAFWQPSGAHLAIMLVDPQSWNSYAYARNNPIKYLDPDGYFWSEAWSFAKGVGNSIGSNNLLGFGRQTSDNRYYRAGQTVGDVLSLVQGSYESVAGIVAVAVGTGGGIITSPTGVGAAAGAGVSALGAAAATHGLGVAGTAMFNLMNNNGPGPSSPNPNGWRDPNTLQKHFNDHGSDFRASDPNDYAHKAQGFRLDAESKGYMKKVDSNGDALYYDSQSNTFGVFDAKGETRTFYKPDPAKHGYKTNMDYWKAQRGKTIR